MSIQRQRIKLVAAAAALVFLFGLVTIVGYGVAEFL